MGSGRLPLSATSRGIEVEFHLRGDYPEEKRCAAENFKLTLHAGGEPVPDGLGAGAGDPESVEYALIPDARYPTSIEVSRGGGWKAPPSGVRRPYEPYFAFEHAGATGPREIGTYVVHQRLGATGRWRTTLRLTPARRRRWSRAGRGALGPRALHQRPSSRANSARARSPCRAPTSPSSRTSPISRAPRPRLIRRGARARVASGVQPGAPSGLARLRRRRCAPCCSSMTGAARRPIAAVSPGIRRMTLTPEEQVLRGARRCAGLTPRSRWPRIISVDRADVYLFGLVLSRFLRLYASINSFVRVTLEAVPLRRSVRMAADAGPDRDALIERSHRGGEPLRLRAGTEPARAGDARRRAAG